jgi:CheY-like chemotaxis protein
MLRRLIGEHIEVTTVTRGPLARIKADPGQIEQAVMNLAVNARDAMARGGKLIIATANEVIDAADPARYGDTPAGRWVSLSVTDSGTGMDSGTLQRIFEPFFTTKGVGKGTGLGLSMVYGIVKQSGGHIHVVSEPGKGSTFTIFLPVVDGPEETPETDLRAKTSLQGSETVLLVEDEEMVRTLGERTLRNHGYQVLSAAHGPAALDLMDRHSGSIELLLTDVVMPQMSGKELADVVSQRHPTVKVLYMSGYTDDTIVDHGVLQQGVSLLQKPFTPGGMARRVREVLDAPA